MLKSKIKNPIVGHKYRQPHFFINVEGAKAGMPRWEHRGSCFIFLAENDQDACFHFQLLTELHHLGILRPHAAVGRNEIYFRLGDFVDLLEEVINSVNTGERSIGDVPGIVAQIKARHKAIEARLYALMDIRRRIYGWPRPGTGRYGPKPV